MGLMADESDGQLVTQRSIAKALGVSHSTVSRALHDDPRISVVRRRRIQAVAAEMGYRFNPMAVALSHHRKVSRTAPMQATLAWINLWSEPERLYNFHEFKLYFLGVREAARRDGYRLEEFVAGRDMAMPRLQGILHARGIEGILLSPLSRGRLPADWEAFDWSEFCVVRFGHSIEAPRFHLVSSDQVSDGIIGYDRIRAKGYRRVGVVTSRFAYTRFAAGVVYQQGKDRRGGALPPLVLTEDDRMQDQELLRRWMAKHRPDAIFTGVASLRDLLQDIGCRVPADVGLAAFSVLDGGADAGIDQNSRVIGKAAVQMLISLVHHHERGIPATCRELLVEGQWQDGSTLPDAPSRCRCK
jgi:LacI family transcriptional regulator